MSNIWDFLLVWNKTQKSVIYIINLKCLIITLLVISNHDYSAYLWPTFRKKCQIKLTINQDSSHTSCFFFRLFSFRQNSTKITIWYPLVMIQNQKGFFLRPSVSCARVSYSTCSRTSIFFCFVQPFPFRSTLGSL